MNKKPSISPEKYNIILKHLSLNDIRLKDLNSKFDETLMQGNLILDVREKHKFKQEVDFLSIFYQFHFTAKDELVEKPAIEIKATYLVTYKVAEGIKVTKEFMKIFSELTIGFLLWPYFRELTNNITYRMGIPPVVLPMKRITE